MNTGSFPSKRIRFRRDDAIGASTSSLLHCGCRGTLFSRAAQRLHIEQSPLSRAFKELKEDLGAQLFVRTMRSTRLTRAGTLFMEHVPRVLTVQQARDSVKAAANGFHGQLCVVLSDGIPPSRLVASR